MPCCTHKVTHSVKLIIRHVVTRRSVDPIESDVSHSSDTRRRGFQTLFSIRFDFIRFHANYWGPFGRIRLFNASIKLTATVIQDFWASGEERGNEGGDLKKRTINDREINPDIKKLILLICFNLSVSEREKFQSLSEFCVCMSDRSNFKIEREREHFGFFFDEVKGELISPH